MKRRTVADCVSMVPYYRTSTDDQLLGIDAQRETVERIAAARRCSIARTYTEHESGGDNDRPELTKAINHARRIGAILVVAKLDRLSRDPVFLLILCRGNVPILFGDMPELDATTPEGEAQLHMMAMMAGFERRRIGQRTKAALAVLKARGVKLGTPANLTTDGRLKGSRASAIASRVKAISEMSEVIPIIQKLRLDGGTLQQIADHLNAEGYVTRKGKEYATTQVLRILRRVSR